MRLAWGIVAALVLVLLALAFGAFHFDQTTIPFGRVKFIPMLRMGSAAAACEARMRRVDELRALEHEQPVLPRGVLSIGGPRLNLGVIS